MQTTQEVVSESMKPTRYAIGPFAFDDKVGTVTLAPGAYTLKKPVVFGVDKRTKIEDIEYDGSLNADVVATPNAMEMTTQMWVLMNQKPQYLMGTVDTQR